MNKKLIAFCKDKIDWEFAGCEGTEYVTIPTQIPDSLDRNAITVTVDSLGTIPSEIDLRQGDLFNGWPEDGEPITVSVNTENNK